MVTPGYNVMEEDQQDEEDRDSFPVIGGATATATTGPALDRESMDLVLLNSRHGRAGTASVATATELTELASTVGSSVIETKEAFLKSITFINNGEIEWGIQLTDSTVPTKSRMFALRQSKQQRLLVESVRGCVALSHIEEGDYLKSINSKKLGPSYNSRRAMELMSKSYQTDGYLSLTCGNKEGDDIFIQATIIKPRPGMTYEQMGMVVWFWGYLCKW